MDEQIWIKRHMEEQEGRQMDGLMNGTFLILFGQFVMHN